MSPAEIYICFLETHTKKKDFFFLPADPEWCLTEGQEMVQFLNSFDITATQRYLRASYIGTCLSERMVLISTVKINSYIDFFNKKGAVPTFLTFTYAYNPHETPSLTDKVFYKCKHRKLSLA